MSRRTGVMLPVLLGAGVLLLPTLARADARIAAELKAFLESRMKAKP